MQENICLFSMFLSGKYAFSPQKGSLPFNPPWMTRCKPRILLLQGSEEPIPIVTGHPRMNSDLQQVQALQHSV